MSSTTEKNVKESKAVGEKSLAKLQKEYSKLNVKNHKLSRDTADAKLAKAKALTELAEV